MSKWPDARLLIPLLLLSGLLALVVMAQLPGETVFWRAMQNAAHVPVFTVISLLLIFLWYSAALFSHLPERWRLILLLLLLLSLALLTELLQGLGGRQLEAADLRRDAYGIAAGMLLYAAWQCDSWRSVWRVAAVSLALVLLLGGMLPLLKAGWHSWQRNQAMPVVMDLSAPWSDSFVLWQHARWLRVDRRPVLAAAGRGDFSEVELQPAQYPGVEMIEPVADWSAYHRLTLVIHSSQQTPFELVLRIHDAAHNQQFSDRFNRRLQVLPGDNQFHIDLDAVRQAPAGREMDLTQIAGIALFAVNLRQHRRFSTSPLWLLK